MNSKLSRAALAFVGVALAVSAVPVRAGQSFTEGLNAVGTLPPFWITTNHSTRPNPDGPWTTAPGIVDDLGNVLVSPFEGAGAAIVNYASILSGTGTINNWLISPEIFDITNGDVFSFYTTTVPSSEYPDRLELRLSTNGASTDVGMTTTSVGDFRTTLAEINLTLAVGGYPETWTMISATVEGLAAAVDGRVAFRYFVTSAGPTGVNSNIIAVDSFSYSGAAPVTSPVPEPETYALLLAGVALLGWRRRLSSRGDGEDLH